MITQAYRTKLGFASCDPIQILLSCLTFMKINNISQLYFNNDTAIYFNT